MPLSVGDVFKYAGTGPKQNMALAHGHVVVKVEAGDVYCVPISREPANWDATCEINVNDNVPGVIQKSFMAYYHAKKSALAGVEQQLLEGKCTKSGSVSAAVLTRIIAGVSTSDECEPWFQDAICPKPVVVRRVLRSTN